ncbi:MAG TPA: hypothetical protein VHL57_13070 [Flavobacteriales bacterium]|nr:hypothetical protein [Flavobacteriales bacterium]
MFRKHPTNGGLTPLLRVKEGNRTWSGIVYLAIAQAQNEREHDEKDR